MLVFTLTLTNPNNFSVVGSNVRLESEISGVTFTITKSASLCGSPLSEAGVFSGTVTIPSKGSCVVSGSVLNSFGDFRVPLALLWLK